MPVARLRLLCLVLILVPLVTACSGNVSREAYGEFADRLVAKGFLRTEPAPADAPFTNVEVERNFHKIAFQYEFHFRSGRIVNEPLDKPLNRWQGPVRYKLIGDAHTTEDAAEIARLMRRISALTGLDIARVEDGQNMLISIATPAGRETISRMFARAGQPVFQARYDTWRQTPGWVCGATLSVEPDVPDVLVGAHIFIGSEVTGRLRRACLHEEIVQSLGLTNDSRAARPSIFNDDQEFAVLTDHDALLLRVLYHPELHPGMGADEAMPVVKRIIAQLRPELDTPTGTTALGIPRVALSLKTSTDGN